MIKTFTIPGKPVGYYAQGKMPNWTRMKQYHEWKMHAQNCARAAGLGLPLIATKQTPVMISVKAYFESGVHCDPGNVQKGTADALFWTPKVKPKCRECGCSLKNFICTFCGKVTREKKVKRSSDKYTGGHFTPPMYDPTNPRVEVRVEFVETGLLQEAANG